MNSVEFFDFCKSNGLISYSDISEKFCVSSQTIRNWEKRKILPYWVYLATFSVNAGIDVKKYSFSDFKKWQKKYNLNTYADTGDIFSVKRQAIHQWFRRGKFPDWLGIACVGYDVKMKNNL